MAEDREQLQGSIIGWLSGLSDAQIATIKALLDTMTVGADGSRVITLPNLTITFNAPGG